MLHGPGDGRPLSRSSAGILGQAVARLVALAGLLGGCGGSLDMAAARGADQPATTIRYEGVAEANRQFPDYSHIRAGILSGSGSEGGTIPPQAESPRAPGPRR